MRSVLTALCLFASTAHAVPAQFTHQGRLLDADGAPLEDEATIMFRVTNDEVGGDELWEETITVPLTNGFYSAILGASEDNPLDTDVLSQAPVWLELQIDGEPAMFPRSPINAVPYATMATVAEELSGGPVDASQIAVDGTPVVNELGEWVGPAPTVSWSDIEGMPEDFADGIDDDTVTDSDSFAALGISCIDGDIPVWDSVLVEWACGIDAVLTEDEVDAIVADNGYAMESEVFSSSFLDLTDVPDGLDDGDDNTQLSESEVDGMVADNGYAMAADAFSRMWSDLVGIPEDLADGDDNTQLSESEVDEMVADNGYALASDSFSGSFLDLDDVPSGLDDGDDNTQLSESEVDEMVADNGYALTTDSFTGSFLDLDDVPSGLDDGDDNTQLSGPEVVSYITEAPIDLAADSTIGGGTVLTTDEAGYVGIGTSSPTTELDVAGQITHEGVVLTEGINIDQIGYHEITMRLTEDWEDTGINGSDLTTGSYLVRIFANDHDVGGGHYSMTYTGHMSWFGSGTNGSDALPISVHSAGHASGGKSIYLRTIQSPHDVEPRVLRLQIRISISPNSDESTYKFWFRRLL
jgi:hypothetical protein